MWVGRPEPGRGGAVAENVLDPSSSAGSKGPLAALARAYSLEVDYLRSWGLSEIYYCGEQVVRVPYLSRDDEVLATAYLSASGGPRRTWKRGDWPALHGLQRLAAIRRTGWVVLVAHEAAAWVLQRHGLPVLAVPGWASWRSTWAELLAGLEVYVWSAAEDAELPAKMIADLPGARRLTAQPDGPGPLEAQLAGTDVGALVAELKETARPLVVEKPASGETGQADLYRLAAPFLAGADVLAAVGRAIRRLGYGGTRWPALVLYLAMSTRLLLLRRGAPPVHACVMGPPSLGKSFLVYVVQQLVPEPYRVVLDAGSPAAIIYEPVDLRHRVLIVGEADSLPTDEDSPLASAVRNLLQEGFLRYSRPCMGPDGSLTTQVLEKAGPTAMVTSTTRRLPAQMGSRFVTLWLDDSPEQLRAALAAQAALEVNGPEEPDRALLAHQAYLQERAPWDVVVPFAPALGQQLGRSRAYPRVSRDFPRVLALTKAAAVLQHSQREVGADGRLIAQIADYRTVYELVAPMYADNSDGVAARERAAVEAVRDLLALKGPGDAANGSEVAARLGISVPAATHRLQGALEAGWLVNAEARPRCPYKLRLGNPLPPRSGLPEPASLLDGDAHRPPDCQAAGDLC